MRRFLGVRLAAAGSALACVLALIPVLPASATSTSNSHSHAHSSTSKPDHYLALGDSVPFGYNPLLVQLGVNPNVFVGYPELASNQFRPKLKVFNASCPGETSSSLISGTRPDNGCQNYRQHIGALHVSYQGSQLQYAEAYLRANPRTKFVTLMIGANDLFRLQDSCKAAVPPAAVNACVLRGLPSVLATVQANLITIYAGLRAAGYRGGFVAVTYYSTNYRDLVLTGAVGAVDGVLAGVTKAFGGKIAKGFGRFAAAAAPFGGDTCAAGLLIHLTTTTCDVHPSPAGAALLASAVRAAEGP